MRTNTKKKFTATSEAEMRDLAAAYRVYVSSVRLVEEHYGKDNAIVGVYKKRFEQNARNALGEHFETARRCYRMMYGKTA